jgi:hypothetical protein
MDSNEREYLGLVQYVGPSVEAGYLDARKSAEALLGLDDALRHFIDAQSSELSGTEYEIPVLIQKGSWQAIIPDDVASWVITALGGGSTAYVVEAARSMAKNDFREVGLRQVFMKALEAIQWTIRIGKHLGTLAERRFEHVRWRNGNAEVGITNAAGDLLFVPREFLELYERMPARILVRITSVVTEERWLEVVVRRDGEDDVESVTFEHKAVFCPTDGDVLFPELGHGAAFDCEGLVTRGNENSNSLGFLYKGHILTCYPHEGSIVRFKDALFLESRIVGSITREDRYGEATEPRPKIIFTDVSPIEANPRSKGDQQPLFFDDET